MLKKTPLAAAALVTLMTCGGCLTRKEAATVAPDGAVSFECTFQGDASEFKGPDALPQPGGAWVIEDEPSVNSDGVPQLLRVARRTFPAGTPIADSYAVDAADAETSLRFPTTVSIEDRPDGTYYHFRRVYRRRDDAMFTTMRRALVMDTERRGLIENPESALNDEQRLALAKDLRDIELEKQLAILDLALSVLKELPQDIPLRIRAELIRASDGFDLKPVIGLLASPKSEPRDKEIQAQADKYLAALADAAKRAVGAASLTPEQLARFQKAYATEKRRREVTEALNSHLFEFRLKLPGELIAGNADRVEDGEAIWEFQAISFQDTDKVILATSRVAKDRQAR